MMAGCKPPFPICNGHAGHPSGNGKLPRLVFSAGINAARPPSPATCCRKPVGHQPARMMASQLQAALTAAFRERHSPEISISGVCQYHHPWKPPGRRTVLTQTLSAPRHHPTASIPQLPPSQLPAEANCHFGLDCSLPDQMPDAWKRSSAWLRRVSSGTCRRPPLPDRRQIHQSILRRVLSVARSRLIAARCWGTSSGRR